MSDERTDYVGYVGSQHWELIAYSIIVTGVLYRCRKNSVKISLVKCKHWLKANKWARALRDTLLVFLLGEGVLLFCFVSFHYHSLQMQLWR